MPITRTSSSAQRDSVVPTACAKCTGILIWSSALRAEGKRPQCYGFKQTFPGVVSRQLLEEEVSKARSYGLYSKSNKSIQESQTADLPSNDTIQREEEVFRDFFESTDINPSHTSRHKKQVNSTDNKWGDWTFMGIGQMVTSDATERVGLPPSCVWGAVLTSGSLSAAKKAQRAAARDGEVPMAKVEQMNDDVDVDEDFDGWLEREKKWWIKTYGRVEKFWEPTLNRELPGRMLKKSGELGQRVFNNAKNLPHVLSFLPKKFYEKYYGDNNDE